MFLNERKFKESFQCNKNIGLFYHFLTLIGKGFFIEIIYSNENISLGQWNCLNLYFNLHESKV